MMSPFICGSGTFQHQEHEDEPWSIPSSSPRKSRKNSKDSKNPYSSRGLDKFSALLTELEEKKQKIYSQKGSEDISLVRFVYSSSNDCVPVVVKLRDQKQDKTKIDDIKDKPAKHNIEGVDNKLPTDGEKEVKQPRLETDKKTHKNRSSLKLHKWRRPSYYMPVAVLLILLFLALFGRSFTILCTSLGWYLVPTLSPERPTKKEYARRLSEPKMASVWLSSPRKNNIGALNDKWPQEQGHRKSF